jgi:ElaB/YqjD/DUF883 family membrane-anchored ribosome-binding protein
VDRESPEVIEKEMQTTRESLTEKVSLLEQQVVGTLQSSTTAVQDTVQSVKSAVQDTVDSVTGTVKDSVSTLTDGLRDALDLKRQVRENPWACVGGAAAVGFITGMLVFRRESSMTSAMSSTSAGHTPLAAHVPAAAPTRPGWLGELLDMAGQEVKKIAQDALTRATSQLKQTVQEQVPKMVETAVGRVTEPLTETCSTQTGGHANGRSGYSGMRN